MTASSVVLPAGAAWRRMLASDAAVAAAVALWLAATAWARPLMLPDEGRYVGVAWEMLSSGQWLVPTLNGLPFFHKPPLFYWLTAAAMGVGGPGHLTARVAPLLGAWIGAMSLYLFASRWAGRRVARGALVALLCQPLWFVGGQFANLDMLVAGLIGACVLALAHAVLQAEQGQPHQAPLMAGWCLAALGVLAKGLIGFVIPAAVIVGWMLLRGQWRGLRRLISWPGLLMFLVLAAPWFLAVQQRHPEFLHYFFVVQHFQRFAEGGFNNVQPVWFYPVLLSAFSLPWWPWIWRTVRSATERGWRAEPLTLLMGVWLVVVVVFFSLPQSKLVGYVLPALWPLAFVIGSGHARWKLRTAGGERLWRGAAALGVVVGCATVATLAIHPPRTTRDLAHIIAAAGEPAAPVVMWGSYAYDLGFYAGLKAPARVVDDWRDREATRRDNWRKELKDAGRFDPARAADILIGREALAPVLCAAPATWILGEPEAARREPLLAAAPPLATESGLALWRITPTQAGCAGRPSGGPASK